MKRAIPLIVLLHLTLNGFSKCGSNGMDFWPSGQTVFENSIFVIEGYGSSQEIIKGFNTNHRVYLISDGQIVNLRVLEIHLGQFNLTQAILKPETVLRVGSTYELMIENLPDYEEIYRYDITTDYQKEKVKWIVAPGYDTTAPSWKSNPKFREDSYERYGCGPAVHAIFSCVVTDTSEILVKTTVKNLPTGVETTYYLKPDNQTISVGHGMCAGAFQLSESDYFEVEFSLIDASGNMTVWTGDRLKFKRPE
jgi:hypothetical protein